MLTTVWGHPSVRSDVSDRLVEDGDTPTVPRCRVCGALVSADLTRCPRCGSGLAEPAWRDESAEATWLGLSPQPVAPGGPGPARRPERRTTVLIVGCVGLALALTLAGVLVSRGRDPAPTPVPTSATRVPPASTTVATTTVATPTSGTGEALPRSTALPASRFVVPRGGVDDQRLYLANVDGSIELELQTPPGHAVNSPTLSANRETLIYIDRTEDSLRTIAADGSHDRLLLESPVGCASITHVTWNPVDQAQLIVRCAGSDRASRLLVCTLDGEVRRELDPPHLRFDDPALAPDGVTLAYWASDEEGPGGGSLYVLPIDGDGPERRLTSPGAARDADPAWSPDGSQLAFTRRVDAENAEVYGVASAGGRARALTTGPGVDQKPAWSPDGTRLLVVSDRTVDGGGGGRTLHLYLVEADDGQVERLSIGGRVVSTPVWSRR